MTDNRYMIISRKQAEADRTCEIPADLAERVRNAIALLPEVRAEKVAIARRRLETGVYSSRDVADKMITSAVSDAMR